MGKSSNEEEGCFCDGDCNLINQERVEKGNDVGADVPFAEGGFCCCCLGFWFGFWVLFVCLFFAWGGISTEGRERRNSKASAVKKG